VAFFFSFRFEDLKACALGRGALWGSGHAHRATSPMRVPHPPHDAYDGKLAQLAEWPRVSRRMQDLRSCTDASAAAAAEQRAEHAKAMLQMVLRPPGHPAQACVCAWLDWLGSSGQPCSTKPPWEFCGEKSVRLAQRTTSPPTAHG
jgi:hypothetical protein